jgi:acetone carboxylase gamma subunit
MEPGSTGGKESREATVREKRGYSFVDPETNWKWKGNSPPG